MSNPRPILSTEMESGEQSPGMCFKLLGFLNSEPDSTASASWQKMKEIIADMDCPYKDRCEIYAKTIRKYPGTQLTLM